MDSAHHIFVGTGAVQVGAPVDSYESAAFQWIPLADIPKLIAKQHIHGSTTMASLLLLLIQDSRTREHSQERASPRDSDHTKSGLQRPPALAIFEVSN